MNLVRRYLLTSSSLVLLCAAPASAQYMYLDTNGDGVNTPGDRIPFSEGGEFTNVDVWLDTTASRDGTAATCASSGEPLSISSYEFCLSVVGGGVDWGTITNHMPFFGSLGAQKNPQTYYNGFSGGTLPPGRYHLATLQVAWRSLGPAPPYSLEIVATTPLLPGARTAFQSDCGGANGDGFLRLGTDWFDTSGLPFGSIDYYPVFSVPPLGMVVPVNGTATQAVEADDPDGAPTSLTLVTGPSYLTTETLFQGGSVIVRLRASPAPVDLGGTYAVLSASDGMLSAFETFNITVTPPVGSPRIVDFEAPPLGASDSQVIDPYVDPSTGVAFHALPSGSFTGVVGLVKNSVTGCTDPSDDNQRLGTAPLGSDQIGRAGHPIEARFPSPLEPPVSVSVEIKTLNLALVRLRLFDTAGSEVGVGREIMLPALTNCGTLIPLAVRTFTATSTRTVASAQVTGPGGLVFTIDNFQFSERALPRPPIVVAPAAVAGIEGSEITVSVSASDPDGDAIGSLTADPSGLPLGHGAVFTTDPANTSGTLTWTPSFTASIGSPYIVTFTAENALSGSATTSITVEPCPVVMGFDFTPGTLDLRSMGKWVTGYLEPPAPHTPPDIDRSSLRLNGIVPVDPAAPIEIGDHDSDGILDLMVKFNRGAVDLAVSEGDSVAVTLTGSVGGQCFHGTDYIRVLRAVVNAPAPGSVLTSGATSAVRWTTPSGVNIQSVALLSSVDDGATWGLEAHGLPNSGTYDWTVPDVATGKARLAVVLVENSDETGYLVDGVLGTSGAFSIQRATGVETGAKAGLALRIVTPNPTWENLRVDFSLPDARPARIEVFNVSGQRVASRDVGWFGPGAHSVTLGERASLASGVYIVRLSQGGIRLTTRAVLVR